MTNRATLDWQVNGMDLTPHETRILIMLSDGASPAEIAECFFVSQHTVRSHLQRIHAKVGAVNRAHAVAIAFRKGILT